MTLVLLISAALVPALGIERVTLRSLRRVRDAWLWGLLALATAWVGWREPWLGVIGCYLLWWWPQPPARDPLARAPHQKLPTVLTWVGVGVTWHIGLALPDWAWAWIVMAWGIWAWAGTGALLWERSQRGWALIRGGWGMRSVTAALLALVIPLLPPWAWVGPAVGVWCSGPSWLAVGALGAASVVRWPGETAWVIGGGILGLALLETPYLIRRMWYSCLAKPV